MLKDNLFSFFGHIAICILSAFLLAQISKIGFTSSYLEFLIPLAACAVYYFFGSKLKKQSSGIIADIVSTCAITLINILLWLLSFSCVFGTYKLLTLGGLPFRRYRTFLYFNSPFIPIADSLTRNILAESSIYEFAFILLAFLPQIFILIGLRWNKKSVRKKIYLLISTVLVIAAIAFIPAVIYPSADTGDNDLLGNTAGNLANGGQVCMKDGMIYYTVRKRIFFFLNSFFEVTGVNGRSTKRLGNYDAGYINVRNEWVYFVDMLKDTGYRIKTDGSELAPLTDDKMRYLIAVGNNLYFQNMSDGGKLYRISGNGNNKVLISPDTADNILYKDGFLYYCNDTGLFRINADGTDKKTLCEGKIKSAVIEGDNIYFIDQGDLSSLYSIFLDGSGKKYLDVWYVNCFNVRDDTLAYTFNVNDYLYFCNSKNGSIIDRYHGFLSNSIYFIDDSVIYVH